MAAGFFVFCFISSVLLTGVTSLKCQACFVPSEECTNEDMIMMECEQDQTLCLSLTLRTTFLKTPFVFTAKTCAKPEECKDSYYGITSTHGNYYLGQIMCCQSDGCNAMPLSLPGHKELKPNGFVCPGSYTKHGDPPQKVGPVRCRDKENQCIKMNFRISSVGILNDEATVQGCATHDLCSYPEGETQMFNGLIKINISSRECRYAAPLLFH